MLQLTDAPRFSAPRETDTFKLMAARSFNSLPDSVRQLTDYQRPPGSICSRNSKLKSLLGALRLEMRPISTYLLLLLLLLLNVNFDY